MNTERLPESVSGKWIWLDSLRNTPNTFVLMRREFDMPVSGGDATLWISANSSYTLFINGRLVGSGPRAHHRPGCHFVDRHDVGYYFEPGNNLIAVQVGYDVDPERGDSSRVPGLWCQLEDIRGEILRSDESWLLCPGECFSAPRARISQSRRMTQYLNSELFPTGWHLQDSKVDSKWRAPDLVIPANTPGAELEAHPLAPGAINSDTFPFECLFRGRVGFTPEWSDVRFPAAKAGAVFAAVTYVFSEGKKEVPFRLYSDTPFRFFCNRKLAAQGAYSDGKQSDTLTLSPGWNRILAFAQPYRNAMGILLTFPESTPKTSLHLRSDMIETAPHGWCVSAPLKMTLAETSPAVRIEKLQPTLCETSPAALADPFDLLAESVMERMADNGEKPLQNGEYMVFRLEHMRYGFSRVEIQGYAGDIVDIVYGGSLTPDGAFVRSADSGCREIATIRCRNGVTEYLGQRAQDCLYVALYVRHTRRGIRVRQIGFDELTRAANHEGTFNCSDELLNRLWEAGRRKLVRSSAYITPEESRKYNDCYLLDSYIDAANMAAMFGDCEYIAFKLRQFIESQLEDGSIPALSFGRLHSSQLPHLFFFPNWLMYNYRVSANREEFLKGIPALDAVRDYLESMLDDETALLDPALVPAAGDAHQDYFTSNRKPLFLNALYCRFMLSAAEIYRLLERENDEQHCLRAAQAMAETLIVHNYDAELKLFTDAPIHSDEDSEFSLFGNFCAMQAGIRTEECFENFFHAFFEYNPPESRSPEADSPYFNFLFLEMLFALRQREWAYRYFRSYWEKRLAGEASDGEADGVRSTGFSGGKCFSPNLFLVREIVGVRIAEPGHSVIFFNPAYQLLDMAEATLPMARGRLRVKWLKTSEGTLDISLDSSVPVRVVPELPQEVLQTTIFRLGDDVTLLAPPAE